MIMEKTVMLQQRKRLEACPWLSQKFPENRHGTRTARAYSNADADEAAHHRMPRLPQRVRGMNPRRAKKAWARAEAGAAGRAEAAIRRYVMAREIAHIDQRILANAF